MPSRRRRRQSSSSPSVDNGDDPVSQFGRLLRASAEHDAAVAADAERRRADARARQLAADRHADDLRTARRELDRAIGAVRRAAADRRGVGEADAAWRTAKARVIELETGAPPGWAADENVPAPDLEEPSTDAEG
ncbi:MAG: hypothetical protein ACK5OX_15090 [Desertimonas sp.]